MAGRDNANASLRELGERLALAAVGAAALTGDRVEELVDALAERGNVRRDEARQTVEDLRARWRGDSVRLSERAGSGLAGVFRELGLATRDELDEVELRVAQLEHRLRLVEDAAAPSRTPRP